MVDPLPQRHPASLERIVPRFEEIARLIRFSVSEEEERGPRIRTPLRDVTSRATVNGANSTPAMERSSDDARLMEAMVGEDVSALEALYDRYSALVFSVSLRVLHDAHLAEDVTQEVFLRLWRQPASFDPARGRFISWLMSVTRNRALDELRRMSRRNRSEDQDDDNNPVAAVPTTDRMDDPELGAELAEQREAVRAAMTRLPPEQRRAIELAYFSGLTQVEIADRTGDPLGTVKTRIRLGIRKLRESLEEFVDIESPRTQDRPIQDRGSR